MIVRLTEKQFSMLVYTAAYTINIYRLDHQIGNKTLHRIGMLISKRHFVEISQQN